MARRDRQDRVYFLWGRGKRAARAKGGYVKLASEITWPLYEDAQVETLALVQTRAKQISEARARGEPLETLRQIAMPAALTRHPRVATVDPAPAPAGPAVLTIREAMRQAIGPSPRALLTALREADAAERKRREEERASREATGALDTKSNAKGKQLSPPVEAEATSIKTPGLSAKSCAALRRFWQENPPPHTGIYRTWTQQAKTSRALADAIEDALGADRPFMALTPNDQKTLFTPGVRDNAMKRVSVLLRVSRWVEREYGVSHAYRAPLPFSPTWQQDIRKATRGAC